MINVQSKILHTHTITGTLYFAKLLIGSVFTVFTVFTCRKTFRSPTWLGMAKNTQQSHTSCRPLSFFGHQRPPVGPKKMNTKRIAESDLQLKEYKQKLIIKISTCFRFFGILTSAWHIDIVEFEYLLQIQSKVY